MRSDVTALVLAGGKATRLGGVAKHELVVDGATILERQRAVLAPRVSEIVVAAPHPVDGFRTVRDAHAGVGPLAGIAAGLAAATTPWLLVVAGDMPYLTGELIDRLLAATADAVDAVGIRAGALPEPLLCVLHTRVGPAVDSRLAAGRYKASGLLTDEHLHVRWLEVDADTPALWNVNAPQDLRRR